MRTARTLPEDELLPLLRVFLRPLALDCRRPRDDAWFATGLQHHSWIPEFQQKLNSKYDRERVWFFLGYHRGYCLRRLATDHDDIRDELRFVAVASDGEEMVIT